MLLTLSAARSVHVTLRVLSPLEGLGVIVCQSKKSGAADDQSTKQHEAPLRYVGFASIQADNASPVFKQALAKFLVISFQTFSMGEKAGYCGTECFQACTLLL